MFSTVSSIFIRQYIVLFLHCTSAQKLERMFLFTACRFNTRTVMFLYTIRTNCEEPDFNKATVDFFLVEPWSSRLKTVLDLLETTDPRVQTCMMDYFKGMAERKIQQCVRTYGPLDVKNFEMPPIPETKNLDITKL